MLVTICVAHAPVQFDHIIYSNKAYNSKSEKVYMHKKELYRWEKQTLAVYPKTAAVLLI